MRAVVLRTGVLRVGSHTSSVFVLFPRECASIEVSPTSCISKLITQDNVYTSRAGISIIGRAASGYPTIEHDVPSPRHNSKLSCYSL